MPIPAVTCGADVVLDYSASPRTISLSASATNSPTSWRWDLLSVPPGSLANVGVKGDFTDGVATIQNPTLEIDAAVDGGYCAQCRATNADGQSEPSLDRANGQQLIVVRVGSTDPILELPPDYAFDWGETYNNPNLRKIKTAIAALADDKKVKISSADTTPNYLESKLAAGTGITLTKLNTGGNEQIQVATTITDDKTVKVLSSDTAPSYLFSKLVAGSNITLTTLNPSGNAQVRIDASGGGGGLTPTLQWNEGDLSQFGWDFGDAVSELYSYVEVTSFSCLPVIHIWVSLRSSSGSGGSLTVGGEGDYVTLYCPGAEFRSIDVGKLVSISGSTNPGNDGDFPIDSAGGEYVSFYNSSAVDEDPWTGSYSFSVDTSFFNRSVILYGVDSPPTHMFVVADVSPSMYYASTGHLVLASRLSYYLGSSSYWEGVGLRINSNGLVSSGGFAGGDFNSMNTELQTSWWVNQQAGRIMHGSVAGYVGDPDVGLLLEDTLEYRMVRADRQYNSSQWGIIAGTAAEESSAEFVIYGIRLFEITLPRIASFPATGRWY